MEQNNSFNLLNQLAEESKSLWRINNIYISEAKTDEEKSFWETLSKQKEVTITELKVLVKNTL
jgi:hypothetical protein